MPPLGLGQNDPVEITPKDVGQQRRSDTASAGMQPSTEQDRVKYGVITKVNDNNLVKIRLLNDKGDAEGEEIVNGTFLPLINPLSHVYLVWGALRKGLICRVFWRGRLEPNASSIVEIIADEEHNFLKKEPESNEIGIGPYKIFSGGMSV